MIITPNCIKIFAKVHTNFRDEWMNEWKKQMNNWMKEGII